MGPPEPQCETSFQKLCAERKRDRPAPMTVAERVRLYRERHKEKIQKLREERNEFSNNRRPSMTTSERVRLHRERLRLYGPDWRKYVQPEQLNCSKKPAKKRVISKNNSIPNDVPGISNLYNIPRVMPMNGNFHGKPDANYYGDPGTYFHGKPGANYYGEPGQSMLNGKPNNIRSQCSSCKKTFQGHRLVCMQCEGVELCLWCVGRNDHDGHYLLLVPDQRPEWEAESVLGRVRTEVTKAIVECREPVTIKSEETEEELDPLNSVKIEINEEDNLLGRSTLEINVLDTETEPVFVKVEPVAYHSTDDVPLIETTEQSDPPEPSDCDSIKTEKH